MSLASPTTGHTNLTKFNRLQKLNSLENHFSQCVEMLEICFCNLSDTCDQVYRQGGGKEEYELFQWVWKFLTDSLSEGGDQGEGAFS